MAIADIIVADRLTDQNQKLLPGVIDLEVGSSISQVGILTFSYPVRDMIAAGVQPATLLGKWLHYTHPTAGPWGGHVTNVLPQDGIVSVSGESWASLLRGVVTDGVTEGGVATVLRRLIEAAKAQTGVSHSSTIDTALINRLDPQTVVADVGSDLYEQVLPSILDALNGQPDFTTPLLPFGFNVDPVTRVFRFVRQIGTDRSATVKLVDRVTNTSGAWSDDLTDVINTVTVEGQYLTTVKVGTKKVCKKKHGKKKCHDEPKYMDRLVPYPATGRNQASIAKYGPRSLSLTSNVQFSSQQGIKDYAQQLANAYAINQQQVTIRCADDFITVGTTQKRIFASFFEGDLISVDLSNEGVTGKMVVRHRALDVAKGEMVVSGEAEVA